MKFLNFFFLQLWVIFAHLDPDPDSENGSGSTDLTESGSADLTESGPNDLIESGIRNPACMTAHNRWMISWWL
jgi:hypothetical protein